jgi:hypothetical protein
MVLSAQESQALKDKIDELRRTDPQKAQELQDLIDSMLDESTKYEMAKMMANMESLYPGWLETQGYSFSGEVDQPDFGCVDNARRRCYLIYSKDSIIISNRKMIHS